MKTRSITSQLLKTTIGHNQPPNYEEIDQTDIEDEQTLLTPKDQKTIPTIAYHLNKWLSKNQDKKKTKKKQLSARNLVDDFNKIAKENSKPPTKAKTAKKQEFSVTQSKRRIKEFKREADYHLEKYQLLLKNLQLETRKLSNMRSSTPRPNSVQPPPPLPPRNQPKPKTQWTQRSTTQQKQPLVQNSFRTGYYHPNVINTQYRMIELNPELWQPRFCQIQYPPQLKENNWSAQPSQQRQSHTPRPSLPTKPAVQKPLQPQRNCTSQEWIDTKKAAKAAQVDAQTNDNLVGLLHLAASSQNRPTPKPRFNVAQNREPMSLSAAINFVNSNLQKKTCCQRSDSFAFNKM